MAKREKCYTHFHMSIEEYGLWTHARQLAHESGKFYLSGPKVALEFDETTRNTVYRIGQNLIEKKWFRVLRWRQRNPKTGLWNPTIIYPLDHDEWVSENTNTLCTPCPKSSMENDESMPVSSTSMPDLKQSMPVLRASMLENGNKYGSKSGSKSGSKYGRESERSKTTPPSLSNTENGQPDRQVKEIRAWMLDCTPPLKFLAKSKDGESESTKATIVRRLQQGISVPDIKLAIGIVPLDGDPNPSFAIRDNLDSAVDRLLTDRKKAQATQLQLENATRREQEHARIEQEGIRIAAEAEAALIEDTLS